MHWGRGTELQCAFGELRYRVQTSSDNSSFFQVLALCLQLCGQPLKLHWLHKVRLLVQEDDTCHGCLHAGHIICLVLSHCFLILGSHLGSWSLRN